MASQFPRAVFDCNIYLQALVNPQGAAGRCKQLLDDGKIEVFVSAAVLSEVAEVLTRPVVQRLAPALTRAAVQAFIDSIRHQAIFLVNVPEDFHYARDPKDEPYINLAVVAGAAYLVSRDNDLLDLMTAKNAAAQSFRMRFPLLKILNAPAFLQALRESALA